MSSNTTVHPSPGDFQQFYALEYKKSDLEALLYPKEGAGGIIGLVFKAQDPTEGAPFQILPLAFTKEFQYREIIAANDQGALSYPEPIRVWSTKEENQSVLSEDGAYDNGTFDNLGQLEFYNSDFHICTFLKDELMSLFKDADRILVSGGQLNFGSLATAKEGGSDVFTLKIEAVNSDNEISFPYGEQSFGAPTVLLGVPCPPYWVKNYATILSLKAFQFIAKNIRDIDPMVAKQILCGEFENLVETRFHHYLDKSIKTLEEALRDKQQESEFVQSSIKAELAYAEMEENNQQYAMANGKRKNGRKNRP
ncbi:MAG: hypothetical protein AAFV95_09260 [Bacteroidota bacterium]